MERYVVLDESVSCEWNFTHTVIDTSKPIMLKGQHKEDSAGRKAYESICECACQSDAELVCKSLNLFNKLKN